LAVSGVSSPTGSYLPVNTIDAGEVFCVEWDISGTTESVPCYKTPSNPQLVKPCPDPRPPYSQPNPDSCACPEDRGAFSDRAIR